MSGIEERVAEVLAAKLNIAGPLDVIFGREVGDAATVLLAQEVEHVAAELVKALGLREEALREDQVAAEGQKFADVGNRVRFVTDWEDAS